MTALTVSTSSPPWRPRTSWGRHGPTITGWSRDLPGGAVLAVTEVPGRQSWRWMLRIPAALLPSIVAAEGTATTDDGARKAADQHVSPDLRTHADLPDPVHGGDVFARIAASTR